MRVLLRFANSGPYRKFVEQIALALQEFGDKGSEYVQGLLVDLHPYWRDLWRIRGMGDHILYVEQTIPRSCGFRDHIDEILTADPAYDDYDDETWHPPAWIEYASRFHKDPQFPVIAKISVLPTTSSTLQIRRSLVSIANNQPFFAMVEDRPEAILAGNVQGGVDIGANYNGTLGGFLEDTGASASSKYGLTCAHVATTPGRPIDVDDVGATRLVGAGTVSDSNYNILGGQPVPHFCNPFANNLPEVDAALIELDSAHTSLNTVFRIGKIVDIKDRYTLSPGQTVKMRGVRSGVHDYYVGALGVSYRFFYATDKNYYCFTNLYEIKGKIPPLLNPRLAQPIAPRPRQGDSGAWVCAFERTTSGVSEYSFCGTLTGIDRDVGYVSFADSFISWSKKALGCF